MDFHQVIFNLNARIRWTEDHWPSIISVPAIKKLRAYKDELLSKYSWEENPRE